MSDSDVMNNLFFGYKWPISAITMKVISPLSKCTRLGCNHYAYGLCLLVTTIVLRKFSFLIKKVVGTPGSHFILPFLDLEI